MNRHLLLVFVIPHVLNSTSQFLIFQQMQLSVLRLSWLRSKIPNSTELNSPVDSLAHKWKEKLIMFIFLQNVCAWRNILVNPHTKLVTRRSEYSRFYFRKRKKMLSQTNLPCQSLTPISVMIEYLFSNIWLGKSMVLQINYSGAHPESVE